jgi:predicted MFS family arabinose efflux permease
MIVCDGLRALALTSIVVALPLGWLRFWQIVIVAFVERTLSIFFESAETVALSRIVPSERISEAIARNDAREYTASLLGLPLGGVLFGFARLAPFAVDAASYTVSLVSIAALRTPLAPRPATQRGRLRTEIREGADFIWRIPFLRVTALQAAGTNLTWASLALALTVIARRHGATGAEIGAMFALLGVGGILGSAASGLLMRRLSSTVLVIGSVWWWTVLIAALALTANPFLLGAGAGAAVFLTPAWNGTVVGMRIRMTPDRLQGRVHSVESLLSFGARPFGLLMTGYLLDRAGGHATIAALAAWTLLIAVASTLSPALRRPPT